MVAALIAVTVTYLALRITARAEPGLVRRGFKRGQTVSSSMLALAHGTNDAQKTMGVITLTLITSGLLAPGSAPPFWVVLSAGLAIALGTYMGGWRIIRTLGRRVSDIQPVQGFAAETTSAAVILTSTHLGLPLSTTQVCTGSIFGAGAGRRLAAVHWGMAGRIALAWSFTLPAAAVVGAAASWLAATGTVGVVVVAISGMALAAGIYVASRRTVVNALNVNDVPPPTAASSTSPPDQERTHPCTSTGPPWPRSRSSRRPPPSPSCCSSRSRSSGVGRSGRRHAAARPVGHRHPRPSARSSPGSACSPPG